MPSLLSIFAPTTALPADVPATAPKRKDGEATADSTPFDALLAAAVAGFAFQPQPLPTPPISAIVFTGSGTSTPVAAPPVTTSSPGETLALGTARTPTTPSPVDGGPGRLRELPPAQGKIVFSIPTLPVAVTSLPLAELPVGGQVPQANGTAFVASPIVRTDTRPSAASLPTPLTVTALPASPRLAAIAPTTVAPDTVTPLGPAPVAVIEVADPPPPTRAVGVSVPVPISTATTVQSRPTTVSATQVRAPALPLNATATPVATTTGAAVVSPLSIEVLNAVGTDSRAIIASSPIQTRPETPRVVTTETLGATVRTVAAVPTAVVGNGAGVPPLTTAGVPTTPVPIAAVDRPALAEQPAAAVAAGQPTLFVPASRSLTAPVLVATSQPASVPAAETDARPFVVPTGIDRPAEPVSQAAALRAVTTSPTGLPLTVGERAEVLDTIAATKRAERNDGSAAPAFSGFLERTVGASPTPTNALRHPTPVDQIAEGVLERADVVASGGRTEFRLQLNPPNLGPVDVRIHSTSAGLRAELVSADPAVRQMIESQLPELRHRLEAAGLNVSGFDVSAGDAERRGRRERDDETSDALRPPRRPSSSRPFIAPRSVVGGAVLDVTA